eukprot:m.116004 g.116004  ORF g.116004 m.116004 type:complete len:52 (+) comp12846_c0_seq1:2203-2358(+)
MTLMVEVDTQKVIQAHGCGPTGLLDTTTSLSERVQHVFSQCISASHTAITY